MEQIVFDTAKKEDIPELIRLRIVLKATEGGYPICQKLGFLNRTQKYTDMRMVP